MNWRGLSLIGFIGFLTSCEKDSLTDKVPSYPDRLKKNTDLWSEAANPANPYEYLTMGAYHNNALNYYRDQQANYNSEHQWAMAAESEIIDFFCTGIDLTYCDPSISADILSAIADTAFTDSLFNLSIMNQTPSVHAYLDSLWNVIDYNDPIDYKAFIADMVLFENKVLEVLSYRQLHPVDSKYFRFCLEHLS